MSWAAAPSCSTRWPLAQVGRVEVARNPVVRALCAANKRLAQELDILAFL